MSRPGNNQPHKHRDPAIYKYVRTDTPTTLIDFHFVVPMPRAVTPSRIVEWCRTNCQYGWLMQLPRMGQPTWKNTVLLFESEDEMSAFRDHYCFDAKYHKRPHEGDWLDALGDNS